MDSSINFYQMLFIVTGGVWSVMLFVEGIELLKAKYCQRSMYHHLKRIWNFMEETEGDVRKKRQDILFSECRKLYYQEVVNNKYLNKKFFSPEDLLRKFIITYREQSTFCERFDIVLMNDKNEIDKKKKKETTRVKLPEIVSCVTVVLGLIKTIIELFSS